MSDRSEFIAENLRTLKKYEKKQPSFIPEFSEDQVVLIKNPRNRVGPKHIFVNGDWKDACVCGWHLHGTTLIRVSENADDCVEVVDKDNFDPNDEIICKNCSHNYNKNN